MQNLQYFRPSFIKIFILSIFEWPFYTGFTESKFFWSQDVKHILVLRKLNDCIYRLHWIQLTMVEWLTLDGMVTIYIMQLLALSMLGNFYAFVVVGWFFSKWTLLGTLSECQTIWDQNRSTILLVLIWFSTVCKGYQQMTKVAAGK